MTARRALLLLAVLPAGCAAIRIDEAAGPSVTASWRDSALACRELSPRSRQVLRRHDLDRLYPDRLAEASGLLHAEARRDPRPGTLFALSEIHYLRGLRAEGRHLPEACACYYLAAGYAFHYLFAAALSEAETFDPRYRLACDLYNAGLAKCLAAAARTGQLDPRRRLTLPAPGGGEMITLEVIHDGFRHAPGELGELRLCSEYQVTGLANHHRSYGLGVPLIATRDRSAPLPPGAMYPPHVSYPATAFFRFEGSLDDLLARRAGRLELINPLEKQTARVGDRAVPLETDLTTPLAYYLAHAGLDGAGYKGFLCPDALAERAGLHALGPYEPGKVPVVLVHGLFGSPLTWAPLFNDLQADPELRKRFQFWAYFYPTGSPYLASAAKLREELARRRAQLDPRGEEPALSEMVFVGHSMGGLVSRLMTIDGGDDFWKVVSPAPLGRLRLTPPARAELRNAFYFERQPFVTRAIFLGTPHRGSKLSPSLLGRLGDRLAVLPRDLMEAAKELAEGNPEVISPLPSSVDLLAPDAPALQLIGHRPRPAAVRYHSVIGVSGRRALLVERLFGGGYRQPSDGVVPYASAHLDEAESEVVVDADHYTVHQHPLAILEVRRILLQHARDFEARWGPPR